MICGVTAGANVYHQAPASTRSSCPTITGTSAPRRPPRPRRTAWPTAASPTRSPRPARTPSCSG
jgi:hypothetical protein